MKKDYLDALIKSKEAAKAEYYFVKGVLTNTQYLVKGLKQQIFSVVKQGESLIGKKDPSTLKLYEISQSLNHDLDLVMLKYNQSLSQRAKKLEKFTVMLFGRTMAGKSTIREAITGGDGSSIGQGAQRTTRDIKEYEWKNLRVVDTPGFGAWGGEEDTAIAHSIVEESDLILFLLSSDSVQLSTIQEMKGLRAKNKPVIFVLNVKQDLTKKIHLKRFLKNPESFFSEDKIGGHIRRLEELARDELGISPRSLKVVPLHAQAAYLAGVETNPIEAEQLYKASRLPELFNLLSNEISVNGPVRRIQSLLDSAHGHLGFLDLHLIGNGKQLQVYSSTIDEKRKQFHSWSKNYYKELQSLVYRKVDGAYSSFTETIGSFVDDNIERKNFDLLWKSHLKKSGIEFKIKEIMEDIQNDVKNKVEQFNREVQQDIDFSNAFEFDSQNPYRPFDYKRFTGWGGAISGGFSAIAGVLAITGSANFWNPIGWTFGGIALAFSVFNYFSDSKEKKLKAQKAKVANDIRLNINKHRESSKKDILSWFDKHIYIGVIEALTKDTEALLKGVNLVHHSLNEGSLQCNVLLSSVNCRLIQQSALVINDQKVLDIKNIVRIPGEGSFFTVNGCFRDPELLKKVERSLGELVTIVYDGPLEKMVSYAFGLSYIKNSKVEITTNHAIIYVPKKSIGKVIGRSGWRIKLITALLNLHIEVVESNQLIGAKND